MKTIQLIFLFICQMSCAYAHEWQILIANTTINHIVVNPHNPSTILVGSDDGLFRTQNDGQTWGIIGENIANTVQHLAFNPQNPQMIYAVAGNYVEGIYRSSEIYQSQDVGTTWQKLDKTFIPGIVDLKVNPNNPNILYALTDTGLFYKSINAGKQWGAAINSSGHRAVTNADMMVLHPFNPDIIYVTLLQTPFNPTNVGLFQSVNQGETWSKVDSNNYLFQPMDIERLPVAINPHNPLEFYLGGQGKRTIYKSTDGGITGFEISEDKLPLTIETININPHQPKIVYLGTTAGLYRTINEGKSWQLLVSNAGNKELHIKTIAVNPHDPDTLYIGTVGHGLYQFIVTKKCVANYDTQTTKITIPCLLVNSEAPQFKVELQKIENEALFEVSELK
ncbi:hypothetical protein [Candidatus Albibeggiatoa sp. nov. NOAA]|uniref:WD40/YVTN/BNR-like repeat-containing protein n=1 Tax=Candidatus Albibeggiatoa sp. nov. NOAA TaxID=3162724 RepID=UPI0032FAF134|nr:hypothetical protein [Thiotrichaceae bacterium]